ncbi:hypothetical protein BDZ97DRAFT_1827860 [Flammula alnicola]|nr:hypothetical protein BDZ97DRAFT_1827860 [Flammula alnicola]
MTFETIKHCIRCAGVPDCEYYSKPAFLDAARTAFERIGIPILLAMGKEVKNPDEKYLYLWLELIKFLGIRDEDVRERHRLDRKCGTLVCPHGLDTHSVKRATCMGCYAVFYCDRACQTKDWKYWHKDECKKFAREAWEDR